MSTRAQDPQRFDPERVARQQARHQAQALRDAADDFLVPDDVICTGGYVREWLTARADRIAAGR